MTFATTTQGLQKCHTSQAKNKAKYHAELFCLKKLKHLCYMWCSYDFYILLIDVETYTDPTVFSRTYRRSSHDTVL